jgi:hypothetical protein
MAVIKFDDQLIRPEEEEKKLSGEETFKLIKTIEEAKKNFYISPERLAKIEAEYGTVIVLDYGDEYHLTDEEREAQNNYYKLFARLNKCKRKYRKIDEFVNCARISLQCLETVAKNNTVYSPEEFMRLVMKGKINVNGWFYPKYNGRDKKQLSWEYITEFIFSDKDPKDLIKGRYNEFEFITDDEDNDEALRRLFSEEDYNNLFKIPDPEKEYREQVHVIDLDEEEIGDESSIAIYADREETKDFIKTCPEILLTVKELRKEMKSTEQLNRYMSDIRKDDIDAIEEYDNAHNIVSDSDIPKFKGDITNSKDYHKYLRALEIYENTQIKENYNGKMRTQEEINELKLKETLEDAGWNIRALYDNQIKEKKLKKAMKVDKEREKKLKKQLTKVENRSKRRMGIDIDETANKKKKKKKNKKKSEDD